MEKAARTMANEETKVSRGCSSEGVTPDPEEILDIRNVRYQEQEMRRKSRKVVLNVDEILSYP